MMQEMMKQCCTADGKPDFEKIKQFMEHCGKHQFSEAELAMMKQFCAHEGMPNVEQMKQMMDKCDCHVP